MASDQGIPFLPAFSDQSALSNEELMSLLLAERPYEPATQIHVPQSTQQPRGNDSTKAAAHMKPPPSVSSFGLEPENATPGVSQTTKPVVNPWQTHHLNLEPAIGSYAQQPQVVEAAAQAQRLKAALAAVSTTRNGRRYLKPWLDNIVPIRFVEMFPQKQLDESITSWEEGAAKLLSRYNKQRAVIGMLDGLTPQESNDHTREALLQSLRDTTASLKHRLPLLSFEDVEVARDGAEQKMEVSFAVLLVRVIRLCLEVQYIYLNDTSTKEYWFQENSYKKRCCELEAWKVAVSVLCRAMNEEVRRLEQRVGQYWSGQVIYESAGKSGDDCGSQNQDC